MMVIAGLGLQSPAAAQSDLFAPEAFELEADLRISAVDGETGWLDGGFGKLREGGDGSGVEPRLRAAAVDLAWQPHFSWELSGLVSLTHQEDQTEAVDLNEAFLKYRSGPGRTRFGARAGLLWPPVSLEHGGANWTVSDTITPSAINSWIGEEVKVLALEASVEHQFGEHELELTGAVFRHNDMSGTLLTYRGWALHDLRTTPHMDSPLPPLSAQVAPFQDTITSPFLEVDKRTGYYARIDWRPPEIFTLNAFRYDNFGDRLSSRDMQTSWRTRFWNVGAMVALDDLTTLRAQALWGNTLVGPDTPYGIPADVDFASAYLLASREVGAGLVSARFDWFETTDNSFVQTDNNNEEGWAAMLAYKRPLNDHFTVFAELLHVSSERPARALLAGIDAQQDQTMAQASLRFHF